jgi:hypothetical protein
LILHPFETTTKEITTTILFLADFLEEHRRVLESRLQPVIREITDSRARTREELESLYRTIINPFSTLSTLFIKQSDTSHNHGQFQELSFLVTFG